MEQGEQESPLFRRLEAVTLDVLDLKQERLAAATHFSDDLGADSLDLVELVEALEREFGVRIEDDELADVATVADAYELIQKLLG